MLLAAKDMEDVEHTKNLLCTSFDARDIHWERASNCSFLANLGIIPARLGGEDHQAGTAEGLWGPREQVWAG